ncbi:hypothetical protein Bhyg_12192, partial [Pseudolycoriella hygida]
MTAKAIQKIIAAEIKGRVISIKLDIATRHHRSMLCVNVQFYCRMRKKIVIRTWGCVELQRSHKSSYLEQCVYTILDLYDIDRKNIYSYTSDNGANLLCLGNLIKKLQQSLVLSEQWKEFQRCGQSDIEDEIVELDAHDQEFDFEFDFNDDMHAQIDSETRDRLLAALNDISDSALLIVFSCAAHTVQLAVHDVLSYIQRANINRIRRVPTKLLADIELTTDDFHYMQQFTEAFEPVYKLTLALQAEQLAMSDVIIHWYRCKGALLKLSKGNEFTELLNDAFDRRTKLIMENPLLATAAYVDPRLNHKNRSDSFLGDLKPIC